VVPSSSNLRHVVVYAEAGRFAGWPANHGLWQWGDELVVGFQRGYWRHDPDHHSIDKDRPAEPAQARSLDGGETWTLEPINGPAPDAAPRPPRPGEIDFTHPAFALRCDRDRFVVSTDNARTWQGPFPLPAAGAEATSRTDYVVLGPQDCLLFLSAKEPRVTAKLKDRAYCARTRDGGQNFQFLSWITGEPLAHRSVMPATARTPEGELITALRRRVDRQPAPDDGDAADATGLSGLAQDNWIDVYASGDDGRTWAFRSRVADTANGRHNGNPPAHVRLPDDRLCVAYGCRAEPYGMRARLSGDEGRTWGPEIILRADALSWDIGYPRMAVRPDGQLITLYYYTAPDHPHQHIAATIWAPPAA
jgi:hypothetical protein